MTSAIVVFGGAGGLGRRIVTALDGRARVISIDRTVDSAHDAADPRALEQLLDALPPRLTAVNATGLVAAGDSAEETAAMVRNNVQGAACIAQVLAPRLEHLVQVSSVSVYGDAISNPISENHPTLPTTIYGATKLAAEHLVAAVSQRSGTSVTVLRLAQLFALPSAAGTFPHTLVSRLRRGESPTVHVDPRTRRDYLHVDDAAQLVALAAIRPVPGTFNGGSGVGTRLVDIEATAYEVAGRRAPVSSGGRDTSQWLDTTAARRTFEWNATHGVIEWIRSGAHDGSGRSST